jgi:eukaryotic-like serine/threonine-protein kinase
MTLAAGTKLGPYEILAPLGSGGMGEVWKARDTRPGRIVAIKKVKEQHSERFKQEAQTIAALNHPYICQLHDIGPDYLVLEYVEGKSLPCPLPERQSHFESHRKRRWFTLMEISPPSRITTATA